MVKRTMAPGVLIALLRANSFKIRFLELDNSVIFGGSGKIGNYSMAVGQYCEGFYHRNIALRNIDLFECLVCVRN